MKKLLFIFLLFTSIISYGQSESFTWFRAQDITNTRHFIWQGDTIDFAEFGQVLDRVDADGDYLYFYSDTTLLDSAYINYTAEVDTFMYSTGGDSIIVSLNNDGLHYLDISSLTSKLDTVTSDNTLTGAGTTVSPLKVDPTILENSQKNTYEITLPIAGTLAGSLNNAVEGTDFPSGWNLSASGANLEIGHNTDRYVANVTVFYNSGGEGYRQLVNFQSAYNNIQNYNKDSLSVIAISEYYTQYKLKVYLLMQ